jgi:hypothetical protein
VFYECSLLPRLTTETKPTKFSLKNRPPNGFLEINKCPQRNDGQSAEWIHPRNHSYIRRVLLFPNNEVLLFTNIRWKMKSEGKDGFRERTYAVSSSNGTRIGSGTDIKVVVLEEAPNVVEVGQKHLSSVQIRRQYSRCKSLTGR